MTNEIRMLCGLQGSGKSTYAKQFKKNNPEFIILSSDEYRKEHPDFNNGEIFSLLYKDMNKYLKEGKSIIYDATNITLKDRKKMFGAIKEPVDDIIAIIVNTPYDECLKNNKKRENPIPSEALERYYHNFQIPFKEEGFNDIIFLNFDFNIDNFFSSLFKITDKMDFDQKSKYHSLSCVEHCSKTYNVLEESGVDINSGLGQASLLHDFGKVYTQTLDDEGFAHYYGHPNVGAYELMMNVDLFPTEEVALEVLFYINYHMICFGLKDAKLSTIKKWEDTFGEEKYNNLVRLYEADKEAH